MSFHLRPITREEFGDFSGAAAMGFGSHRRDEDIERQLKTFEFDRSLAAFDAGQIVGTGEIFSFEMTLPGRAFLPAAGVSWIAVLPTHRRRGILSSIIRRQFSDIRERGEPLAILYASESIIYGRFGYGVSTMHAGYQIDTRYGAFGRAPEMTGRIQLLDKDAAAQILPDVYERFRPQQPGALSRRDVWWDTYFLDPESWRHGASARFYVTFQSATGSIDGYVTYRITQNWEQGFPAGKMKIVDLTAITPEARAGLWKYCLGIDLIGTVDAVGFPSDEPARWMLADSRRLRTSYLHDGLWTRLLDIPTALAARRYATDDRLVFRVVDPFCPENDGCYELEGSPDGATCRRSRIEPDISLEVTDLGSAYLGGIRFSTLAAAGHITEHVPAALRRADSMFASEVTPWCTTDF